MDTRNRDERAFHWGVRLVPVLAFAGSLMFSGCMAPETEVSLEREDGSIALLANRAPDAAGGVVCDPFSDPTYPGSDLNLGVHGKLRYLTADQPRYNTVGDYSTYAHVAPIELFLADLNVPTRAYDRPFMTQTGVQVTNPDGQPFYEYFGVEVEAEVRLAPSDNEGLYQFAVIADDGALLELDQGGGLETIVANDGVHQTRMICGTQAVGMSRDSSLPMKLQYFQGPRYHIALVVLWREWDGVSTDIECGKAGNSYFWDSTTIPSTEKAPFTGLLSRGWKVLKPENYTLPRAIASNPCTLPDPVVTRVTGYVPSAVVNSSSVTLTFESNYADATFECGLNNGATMPCSSPITYSGLTDGSYIFNVYATKDGVRDNVGAYHAWRIDTVPPMVAFISTTATSNSIQIDWTTSEPSTAWVEMEDTRTLARYTTVETSTYETQHTIVMGGLNARTKHNFFVFGRDEAGNQFKSAPYSATTPAAMQ